jgi:hypothetical protein
MMSETGARLFLSDVRHGAKDVRLGFLLADDAYERVVTRAFGIPRDQQSPLVKVIVAGAVATVLQSYAARLPRIHPSRSDTAIGTAVLNSAFRGLAGAPSRNIPVAGLAIGLGVLVHGIRSAAGQTEHDVEVVVHAAGHRYGHHPAV